MAYKVDKKHAFMKNLHLSSMLNIACIIYQMWDLLET